MSSMGDKSYAGKSNITVVTQYGNRIYADANQTANITPPPMLGFLIQDNGFFILQDNGSQIEYT